MSHEQIAEVGDIVLWYPGGDVKQPGQPAIVTQVNMGTACNLNLMDPALRDFQIVDASRHMDDDKAKQSERVDFGGWRHRPITLAIRSMLIAANKMMVKDGKIAYGDFPSANKVAA